MTTKKPKFETVSAADFKGEGGTYRFPFEVLDPTPGGENLGRIEWCIELIWSKRKKWGCHHIEKIYLWAKQTRDPRYAKKILEIECFAEALTSNSVFGLDSYIHNVWYIGQCPEHKTPFMAAYPGNKHTALEINIFSSICLEAVFV